MSYLFKSLGSGVSSFFEFFSGIGKTLRGFGKVFTAVKVIAEKIAIPITIIMGLYDGINEAIEGFKKEGILGGIKGFITGVLNSVIGSFLDLIKDIVSWVAGALGFDQVEKMLDSFSFVTIIKDFVDDLFKGIELVRDMVLKVWNFVSSIKIPEFEIFGMKFGGESIGSTASTQKGATKIPSTTNKVAPQMVTNKSVQPAKMTIVTPSIGNKVYGESAKVDAANKQPTQASRSSTVVSAPTQVNNQTQNASFSTPVRNQDNTINSYFKSRYVA